MRPVQPLSPALFPSAAELLAQAFFDNPAHVYLCPDPRTRFDQLLWLLGGNLRVQPDLEVSFCVARDSTVDAMGFWTRSDAPTSSLLSRIRAGLLAAPVRLGWQGVRRLREVTSEIDRQRERAIGDRPFWYLNNMVVSEELRGSGLGTRLLGEQLRIVRRQQPGAAIALATQRSENVTFYRKLGFEVAWDEPIGEGTEAFRNWIMLYAADAQRSAPSA